VLRPDGSRIATIDVERLRRRTGDPVYLMSRPALLGLLAAAVPGGAVRYGVDVRDVNALQAERDVVVGADGMFSTVRTAVVGSAYQARPTGQTAWRGTVPIHTHASTETWGAGRRFGITPHERGMTNWYATVTDPGCDGDVAELRRHFGRWHDPIPQILAELTEEAILRHEMYQVFPPLPTFTNGSVVLLGDAAHAMTPDLGRGACEALVDAVTLTECLTGTPSVRSALNRYDRIRRRRTQRLAAMSLRMSRVACARRFLWLRDAVVRAATVLGPPA
jgi:2-polyprenyl-6-methoxyphenol hydroxylase-like FAD-dependent oxidoreductase